MKALASQLGFLNLLHGWDTLGCLLRFMRGLVRMRGAELVHGRDALVSFCQTRICHFENQWQEIPALTLLFNMDGGEALGFQMLVPGKRGSALKLESRSKKMPG